MSESLGTVFVSDVQPDHGAAIAGEIARLDGAVRFFGCPDELIRRCAEESPQCVIADVAFVNDDVGAFVEAISPTPLLMVGHQPEVRQVVGALRKGAATFIEVPLRDNELQKALLNTLADGSQQHGLAGRVRELKSRMETLTGREGDVLDLIVAGTANKVIARNLRISHRTVDRLRATVFEKLGAECAVDVARMVTELRVLDGAHTLISGRAAPRPAAWGRARAAQPAGGSFESDT